MAFSVFPEPMQSTAPLSIVHKNVSSPLVRDGDIAVYRRHYGSSAAARVLAVVPSSDPPAHGFLDRLRHEYELKGTLESEWAAQIGRAHV